MKFHFRPVVIIWLLTSASGYYKDSLKEEEKSLILPNEDVGFLFVFLVLLLVLGCSEEIQKILRDSFRIY